MRNPFIAGSFVRAENFFGRDALLREILEGPRNSLWVVGARRLGKTSLLKQLEYVAQESSQSPWVPLYWDIQGAADPRGLADLLIEAVEDSEPFRRATGVVADDLEGAPAHEILAILLRRAVRSGWRLLLLVDEGEELITVAGHDPAVLPRLRRVLQKGPELRAVVTSTRRLARIDEASPLATSPFLAGLIPPLYLTPLQPDEALRLLDRGGFDARDAREIAERTACHPFLLQLIASRFFESHDLAATLEQAAADEMLANFFLSDVHSMEPAERDLLVRVAAEPGCDRAALGAAAGLAPDRADEMLLALRMLGYLGERDGRWTVGNWFFERWLRRTPAEAGVTHAGGRP
ncbi:MAG: hypothetical protein KJ067_14760 [Vicinamibacteria bacterium]|nr:hypothetical protein [Vicinamibacteria bacterium]